MAVYYRESGMSWKQYLQTQSFFDDITDGIRRSERSIGSKIDEQTWSMVASMEALERNMTEGFDRLSYSMEAVAEGIAGLRADFNWAMSGLLHKINVQNLLLRDIYIELRIPDFQKERRYYVEQGCKHYRNGLYQEALESFLKAEPLEKTDPFVLYSIGQIYLYQKDLLELDKAQDYFTQAAKYYTAEKQRQKAGESYFHAGIAAYLLKDNATAIQLTKKAYEIYPELLEAFYNHAKFLATQGDASGLTSLELAIRKERNYALKVINDGDFANISAQLKALLNQLHHEAKENAIQAISNFEKELDKYIILDYGTEKQVKDLIIKTRTLFNEDHYFDYLDCLLAIQTALKSLEEHLYELTSLKHICKFTDKYLASIAFSHDGTMLAIGLTSKVKILDLETVQTLHEIELHIGSHSITKVDFSPDNKFLITGDDYLVRLLDFQINKEVFSLCSVKLKNRTAFSPYTFMVAQGESGKVTLWNIQSGEEISSFTGDFGIYRSITFSQDGTLFAIGLKERVKIWDVKSGEELHTFNAHSYAYVESIAFSSNLMLLAIGFKGEAKIWDIQSNRELYVLKGHSNEDIDWIAFSPNEKLLATATYKEAILWEVKSGKQIHKMEGGPICFSPDGALLASSENIWGLMYKIMPKVQYKRHKRLESLQQKVAEARRKAEEEAEKERNQRKKERERKEAEEYIRNEQLRQQAQWREEGCCETCGEKLSLWDKMGGYVRCKKHR